MTAPTEYATDPEPRPGTGAGPAPDRGRHPESQPVKDLAQRRSAVRSLLRLWPYVRPVRMRLFTAAVVAIVASCVGLFIPLALKWIVDGPVADRDPGKVWLGGALLLALGVAEAGLFGLRRWLVARPLAGVEAAMRAGLYRHLQLLPVAFHDRWPSGQLLSRATVDLQLLRMFLAFPLTFLLVNTTTIVVGCVILLVQEWTLGLLLLAPVLPLVAFCSVLEARYAVASRKAQDQVGDLTTVVEEAVLGIRIIKGFGRHRSQARAFGSLSERLQATELHKARLLAAILAAIVTLPELALGAAVLLGSLQVADGTLSAGTLVAFVSTALALRWPVESMGFLLAMSNASATAADRYFEVVTSPPAEPGGFLSGSPAPGHLRPAAPGHLTGPAPAPGASGAKVTAAPLASTGVPAAPVPSGTPGPPQAPRHADTPTLPRSPGTPSGEAPGQGDRPGDDGQGGIRFEGVTFRYPDAPPDAPPVLCCIDLHVRPGETMALVGATGSGKTTLTALIPRLHEVTAGRITLDGLDIAAIPLEELRGYVAVAFEEPTLFSASVRENVLMGMSVTDGAARTGTSTGTGTGTDMALESALRISQADAFVHALPDGPATQVGEQGLSLSGGQRQRLALARAVVGRPRFLVLDDPLSALDVHTEARVEESLRTVLAETTALIVAHRPSTVLLADRVALLSGGRITAVGSHHDLLRESAEYRALMSGRPAPSTAPKGSELQ